MVVILDSPVPIEYGSPGMAGSWILKPEKVTVLYRWVDAIGYWKVVQSTVVGSRMKGRAPSELVYEFGNHGKPDWLVGLEWAHYPRENPRLTDE